MRRLILLIVLGILLGTTAMLSAQGISGALRIQDGSGNSLLRITHYGGLTVSLYNDPESLDRSLVVSHVSSTLHVAGFIRGFGPQGTNVVDAANLALNVNCVVGCSGSSGVVSHVTSVTHIAGGVSLVNRSGTYVTTTGTALDVNCTGCAAASTVVVSHVSSVTHMAGSMSLVNRAGVYATFTGTALDVNCTGCSASSVVNVDHISAAVHLAGGVTDQNNKALRVTGVTVFTVMGAIDHISSVTHIRGGVSLVSQAGVYASYTGTALNVADTAGQSGVWSIQATHQGGSWSVSVSHISAQLHIAGTHASGAMRAWRADSCGTTARTVINTNTARREIWLTNMGTSNIYLGYGVTGHVALTASNGWPMHAASASTGLAYPVKLRDYQGPVACVTDLGSQQLGILEILRN